MSTAAVKKTAVAATPTPVVMPAAAVRERILSVDAYRGFVMLLMMAEVVHLWELATIYPTSAVAKFIKFNTTHVEWAGCSLHDMIQPSFSFLVGVALPFSLARRLSTGQSVGWATLHAVWRAVVLIFLGIFLRSIGARQTNFTFEDTLTQIGLGYVPLFLLGFCQRKWRWVALIVILVGYWGAFALYPLPTDFNYREVGVSAEWAAENNYTGFAAHWNKNSNLAWAFDTWFMNLLPRAKPFVDNGGGYSTLSFIPTLGTMILGLIAGGWLRDDLSGWRRVGRFVATGAVCLALGYALDHFGICPSVKRIWTPSWVLWSGGWCFLMLAGFYIVIDIAGWKAWSFPLRVIGMNSIAAYLIAHLFEHFTFSAFQTHFGRDFFKMFGAGLEPIVGGAVVLAVYWLILWWMYRRQLFLKI